MNKILTGIVAVLAIAVGFLFYKVYNSAPGALAQESVKKDSVSAKKTEHKVEMAANQPTGKLAYVNIDRLNEESNEVNDLVNETKRRKNNIESSAEKLQEQYQKRIQDYQMAVKAGIAPQSDIQAQEKAIIQIEKDIQDKQLQMDNLSLEINERNNAFQKRVREFLQKWNNGRYDYVFAYSELVPTLLLGNATFEVTDEVIAELNKEYKQNKKSAK